MGGSALLIYGNVKEECLRQRVKPRTIWDRLFGRKSVVVTPEWQAMGKDSHSIDLPVGNLSGIGTEFRDYIIKRFRKPWAATKTVIEYLKIGSIDVYLRGERSENDPDALYIQLSFSGCGGMAQTSADLAVHWAVRWYREKKQNLLNDIFNRTGLNPMGERNRTCLRIYTSRVGITGMLSMIRRHHRERRIILTGDILVSIRQLRNTWMRRRSASFIARLITNCRRSCHRIRVVVSGAIRILIRPCVINWPRFDKRGFFRPFRALGERGMGTGGSRRPAKICRPFGPVWIPGQARQNNGRV
jgi:hypothetical protein